MRHHSLPLQSCNSSSKFADNTTVAQAARANHCDQLPQSLPKVFRSLRIGGCRRYACHACTMAMGDIEESLARQRPIGFRDGVEMNAQIERELANRRQRIARLQCA